MYLLDNGTEGATKRFTASFAFSFACPEGFPFGVLAGRHPFTFGRIGHSSNSLARKR